MTAIVTKQRSRSLSVGTKVLWAAALFAAGLAIAVTLHAHQSGVPGAVSPTAAAEAAAREDRIAFFETRAAADPLDFLSLNVLSAQYMQHARETGDVADYQRAELAATKSLDLLPEDNYAGLLNLALVRLVQHDFAAAEKLARDAMSLKSHEAAPLGLLSDALVGQGLYDEAEAAMAAMVEIDAGLPSLSRLAQLAFLGGDQFNAVDFWRQVIERGEGLPLENLAWTHVQLGATQFALGDLSAAASQHERALALYPGYVHALAGLGQVRAAEGRYDEAIELYSRAVARLPQPQYVAALGDVYAAAGRAGEASEQYALVEAIAQLYRSNGINTDLQIANYYADHDVEPAQALAMARAAYEAAPGVYAADALAWAMYKSGRYEEAAQLSAEAVARGTLEPRFYFHAALISEALGDPETADARLWRLQQLNIRFSPLYADRLQQKLAEMEALR